MSRGHPVGGDEGGPQRRTFWASTPGSGHRLPTLHPVTTLVLTVIGDDRAGLVNRLSQVVAAHRGNWTTSQLAELAGKFAGIVVVEVDEPRVDAFTAALRGLGDQLQITVHPGRGRAAEPEATFDLELVGNDRPGIVRDITDQVHAAGGSIDELHSEVVDAPMSGGQLFCARARVSLAEDARAGLQSSLEALADELMVEFTFGEVLAD